MTSTFGSDFKDQWQTLEKCAEFHVEQMKQTLQFFKKQAEIEKTYAEATTKLVKTFKDDMKKNAGNSNFHKGVLSSTCYQSWSQILNETEAVAVSHAAFATGILEQVRPPLKLQVKDNEKMIKDSFDDIRRMDNDLKKAVDAMEKAREVQDKANREMSTSYVAYEKMNKDPKATRGAVEKQKADADKKAAYTLVCVDAYTKIIAETNVLKNCFFNDQLPKALEEFQRKDETTRIEQLKSTNMLYAGVWRAQEEPLIKSIESLETIFGLISPSFDSDSFIRMVRSGARGVPEDYAFEEKVKSPLRRYSQSLPVSPLSPGLDKMCGSDAQQEEDEIMAMPLKQGRKKALERHRQIMKELPALTIKMNGYDTLLGVQDRDQNKTSQPALLSQRNAVAAIIETLTRRKTKLEGYLGGGALSSPLSLSHSASIVSPPSQASSITEDVRKHTNPPEQQQELRRSAKIRARALFDFEGAANSEELSIVVGDEFNVIEQLDDGWWKCFCDRTQVEGLVPGNYLEEVSL